MTLRQILHLATSEAARMPFFILLASDGVSIKSFRATSGDVTWVLINTTILFHVLGVTGIDYRDGVTIDGIGIIPLIGIGHVVASLLPL